MQSQLCSAGQRVRGLVSNAALVLVADHADVTSLTPRGAPGVLDLPVVLAGVSAVANDEDSVVEVLAASAREDTTLVHLESSLISLDGDGDWSEVNGSSEGVLVGGDVLVALEVGVGGGSAGGLLAGSVLGGVGVAASVQRPLASMYLKARSIRPPLHPRFP